MKRKETLLASSLLFSVALSAAAQDAAVEEQLSLGSGSSTDPMADDSAGGEPWLDQYKPDAGEIELGLFFGGMFPSDSHDLYDADRARSPFDGVAPEIGLRAAYFPWRHLGGEVEGSLMPAETDAGDSATIWAGRAHAIAQLPEWRITPFLLAGLGTLATTGELGNDADPAFHFGGGVKAALTRDVTVRIDVRDTLSRRFQSSVSTMTHHPEVLAGLSFVLGRADSKPTASDRDADGVADRDDRCPATAGTAPDGCPEGDADGDGYSDDRDQCPEEYGLGNSGCPPEDPDNDGVLGKADLCPEEPETKNQYEDADGCPDAVPEAVARFTGAIPGIEFDVGRARIRAGSQPILEEAVQVLSEYPQLKIEVVGHTDSTGDFQTNQDLSRARAQAVRDYLVGRGLPQDRISARGAGSAEPIAPNDSPVGRQKNRRIEFQRRDR